MTAGQQPIPVFDREAFRSVRARTMDMVAQGGRMITIIARENDDESIELIYLFDLSGKVVDFRFTILPDWEVDSVSDIFKGAMNMEREVVDLFGLKYKGVQPGLLLVPGKNSVAPLRRDRTASKKEADPSG